ncbi:MAG: NADH-quinone oxidoreductase subunit B family protein [Candidatus Bathyarchaeota archaeon]
MLKSVKAWANKKSPWVFHLNTGGCNGCDIEVLACLTPVYDVERFGIKLVNSPRHADVLLITGPVCSQVTDRLIRTYNAVPDPKAVIAIGQCPTSNCVFDGSYSVDGPLDRHIPVNVYIPGCPPRPEAIIYGVALALGYIKEKK